MKNVIKVALLSTVAMVGAAQAGIDSTVESTIRNAVTNVYNVFEDTVPTDIQTNLDALIQNVDDVFTGTIVTESTVTFDWGLFQEVTTTTDVNVDSGVVNNVSSNVTALKDGIMLDVWGDSTGRVAYQDGGIDSFDNAGFQASLLGDHAKAIAGYHDEVIIQATAKARGETEDLDGAISNFSTSVSDFVTDANAADGFTTDFVNADYDNLGVQEYVAPSAP